MGFFVFILELGFIYIYIYYSQNFWFHSLLLLWFFFTYFFSHVLKEIVSKKNHIIKLYKVHELVYKFSCLTWFTSLTSLIFFSFFINCFFDFILWCWVNWEFSFVFGFISLSMGLSKSQKQILVLGWCSILRLSIFLIM